MRSFTSLFLTMGGQRAVPHLLRFMADAIENQQEADDIAVRTVLGESSQQ